MATFVPVGTMRHHRITHNMFIDAYRLNVDHQTMGTAGAIAQNSVLQCIPVRIGDIVLQAWINVLTACTGGASADVGVGEDVDCFIDGVAIDGQVVETAVTAGSNGPHRFHAADTVDVTILEAAITAGIIEVCALIVRI